MKKFLIGLIVIIMTIIIVTPSLAMLYAWNWNKSVPLGKNIIIITQIIAILFLIVSIILACKRSIVNKLKKIIVVSLLFGLSISLWWVSAIIMMNPGR